MHKGRAVFSPALAFPAAAGVSSGAHSMGPPHKPSTAGCVGRGGARKRVSFPPVGGNETKRTLRRRWGGASRRTSVLPAGQNLGAGGIHFRRACQIPPGGLPARPAAPGTGRAACRPGEGHRVYWAPNRAQHSGSVGERRSKGAIEEWPPGRSENSGLCDDAAMQDEAD